MLYFNTVVSDRLENTARETVNFYVNQFADQTSSIFDTLRRSVYYLLHDNATQDIMSTDGPPSQMQRLAVEERLSSAFLIGNALDSAAVTGIYLVKNGEEYLSVLRSGLLIGTQERILSVYQTHQEENSAREFYTDDQFEGYCYFIVNYFSLDTMTYLGKIIVEIDAAYLLDTSSIDGIYQQTSALLSSTDGRLISGDDRVGFLEAAAINPQDGYMSVDGESFYHVGKSLSPFRMRIDIFVPREEIFATIGETVKVYIFFAVTVLLITLCFGVIIAYLLSKPIRQMLYKIDRLGAGDLSSRMDSTPYHETQRMVYTFNNMADNLEGLVDEVYNKGLLLREAEFDLLESQIRPHFIFNVLQLINVRCMEVGQQDICRIVKNLAQLLRSNMANKDKQKITIHQEMEYVRYYLELQKERFGDKLIYEIHLEDQSILQYYLPKLTIQPLVENSIVHGLENKREGGTIIVGIWEEENAICIRISDNGIGFDVSALDFETKGFDYENTEHNHVALVNINRRIHLLYGNNYGMTIKSAIDKGTVITITLPVDIIGTQEGGRHAKSHDSGQ